MGMNHSENKIRLAAVEGLGSFVESCEPKESKQFEQLLVPALECIWGLIEKDETQGS